MASLADSLWHRNRVLAEAALEHPFVQGITSGELTRATFAYYVGQDAVFLDAFCRAYALALAKSPDQDGLIAFRELLDAAAAELRLHRGYAERWDVDLHQAADLATAAYTNCSRRSSNSSSTGPIDGTLPPYSRHTRRTAASSRNSLSIVSRSRMVPRRIGPSAAHKSPSDVPKTHRVARQVSP
ncbi:MAG: hypothetical protein QOE52_1745 [Mycobacterium sp.]|nr:hypothetical protein [Mycobacterium sp.]